MIRLNDRMTERAQEVLNLSLREALALGHNYIGTEHILLALVAEGEGVAAKILENLGLDREKIRVEVLRLVGVGSTSLCPTCGEPVRFHGFKASKTAASS